MDENIHHFNFLESISNDGILSWQSQTKQGLKEKKFLDIPPSLQNPKVLVRNDVKVV
jgi:hypothetical protein|tara:strand:- start:341 stop:511 length:171 start_codon:yes stop_codon:yes gene_type:complete